MEGVFFGNFRAEWLAADKNYLVRWELNLT